MGTVLDTLNDCKEVIVFIVTALFGLFGFYYAMKKNELELLLAGEKTRKMHDLGVFICTIVLCGFLNLIVGVGNGFFLILDELYFFAASAIICILGYTVFSFVNMRDKSKNKWYSSLEDVFAILLVALFGVVCSWIDFASATILYCKKNNIVEDKDIKALLSIPRIDLLKKIDLQTFLWICLVITLVEGMFITIMLLNVSLGDSRIQLTMYDSEGGVEKDHLFVYSRIGKRLICGDSPRMITSYKHIYSIDLDDIYKNEKNAFNFYFMSEEEMKLAEELKEKKAKAKAKKKIEKLEKKNEQREIKEFEKAKKKWVKAHNKKAVTKKKWLPKISIKDIKFWVKTESDDLLNPEDLVDSDDTKEATSQENKKQ